MSCLVLFNKIQQLGLLKVIEITNVFFMILYDCVVSENARNAQISLFYEFAKLDCMSTSTSLRTGITLLIMKISANQDTHTKKFHK